MARILLIEKDFGATSTFIQGLHEATGCSIIQAQTIDEGLCTIVQGHGSVDIVLVTLDQQPEDAWRFPSRIRSEAKSAIIKCPNIIVLAREPLPLEHAGKCKDLLAGYMLRGFPNPIYEEVRVLLWRLRTRKEDSTIRIEHYNGHYALYFCVGTCSQEIMLSSQLIKLVLLLAGGRRAYLVEMIAEEMGICRQSVKKYMRELRRACIAAQIYLRIVEPETDVFWMERISGGTLCGLRANVVWG